MADNFNVLKCPACQKNKDSKKVKPFKVFNTK